MARSNVFDELTAAQQVRDDAKSELEDARNTWHDAQARYEAYKRVGQGTERETHSWQARGAEVSTMQKFRDGINPQWRGMWAWIWQLICVVAAMGCFVGAVIHYHHGAYDRATFDLLMALILVQRWQGHT